MHFTNLFPTIALLTLFLANPTLSTPAPPNHPQIRSTPPFYAPIATPQQRLSLLLTPSQPYYTIPQPPQLSTNNNNNSTLLISTPVSPTGQFPFTNATFDPSSADPASPVPFTWMKVQVRRQDGAGGAVVEWTDVPVDVLDWEVGFDVGLLLVGGGGAGRGGEERRVVGLSVVGVSPDGVQSFWGVGEVVVVLGGGGGIGFVG